AARPRARGQLGVDLEADPVAEQRAVGAVERFAVRPVVRAAGAVVALARRPAARAVSVELARLVAQHEPRVLVRRLEDVRRRGPRGPADAVGSQVHVVPQADEVDAAQFAALEDAGDLAVVRGGAVLRAGLDDAVVLPGRLDHGPALADVVGQRLLDVDVL